MITPFRLRYISEECGGKVHIKIAHANNMECISYYTYQPHSLSGVSIMIRSLYGPVSILLTAAT